MTARVLSLHVYPIKGCAGTDLQTAEITPCGIAHDRSYLLVDPDGMFLTQRELPGLTRVRPIATSAGLIVTAPGAETLRVPVSHDGPRRSAQVWNWSGTGIDQGAEAADWFGAVTRRRCRLVRFPDDTVRALDPRFARGQVRYADDFPLMVISTASVADLNTRLAEPVPVNRFRPNLVLDGLPSPFIEDTLGTLRIGSLVIDLVKPAPRCAVITTDQATGERHGEPLRALRTYRRGEFGLHFGQHGVPRAAGTLHVGDHVEF